MSDGDGGKREGMDRAERHADPYWWACMLEAVKEVAQRKPYFMTDDVVRVCRERHPNVTTHENRANGPLMREAAKLQYALPTQDWATSTQPQNHRRPMMIWYSLIYQGPASAKPRKRKIHDPRQINMLATWDDETSSQDEA